MLGSIPYKGREENKCLKLNTNGCGNGVGPWLTLLRTFLNKSTPPLRSLPSDVKNLFHCLALSGLFLFLWDHGDLRRALKTLKQRFNSILLSDSKLKDSYSPGRYEKSMKGFWDLISIKRLTDQKKRRKERKMRRRREQNANGSKKMRRENEEMLMAMKD